MVPEFIAGVLGLFQLGAFLFAWSCAMLTGGVLLKVLR